MKVNQTKCVWVRGVRGQVREGLEEVREKDVGKKLKGNE